MAAEAWSVEYKKVKSTIVTLRSRGALTPDSELKNITDAIRKLGELLKLLRKDSQNNSGGQGVLSPGEIGRRETILENLKKQLPLMSTHNVLRATSAAPVDGTSRGSEVEMQDVASPAASTTLTDKGLVQRQQQIIKEQDATINIIAKGVDNLHDQAKEIGAEADFQLKIVQGLDDNVDAAAEELREEAKNAEKVRKQSQMCCLYMCLALEAVITVLLLIIVFEYEGGFRAAGSTSDKEHGSRRFLREA